MSKFTFKKLVNKLEQEIDKLAEIDSVKTQLINNLLVIKSAYEDLRLLRPNSEAYTELVSFIQKQNEYHEKLINELRALRK